MIPDTRLIAEAAGLLAGTQKPMIFVGDGVAYSGAQDELACVAELVGAEVWDADAGEVNMSHGHPLYQGSTGHMFGYASQPVTRRGDVNLLCGTYVLPEVFPELGDVFAPHARVIHIDLNTYEIAKNHPADIGMLGDPKLALMGLAEALRSRMTTEQKAAAQARVSELARAKESKRNAALLSKQAEREKVPLKMSRASWKTWGRNCHPTRSSSTRR